MRRRGSLADAFHDAPLAPINKLLGQYITDLDKWIEKTTKDIEAAQKLVQNILDEVNGNVKDRHLNHKTNLDEAIATVESKLEDRVSELTKWKEAANGVLEHAINKGNDVHKNMDPSEKDPSTGTVIGKGLQKIDEAKEKVEGVSSELGNIHGDLQTWNSAASGVLSQVVLKAQGVHKRLDPTGSQTLATNIKQIEEAKKGIDTANGQLEGQVNSLNSWITTAESIRKAAEDKAKEAYDKLRVNQTLDENVKKIVQAKDRINDVHEKLNSVHGSLGEWKSKAGDVLTGAIDRANEVYEKLEISDTSKGDLKTQITNIDNHNKAIKEANEQLAGHVSSLESWKAAAQGVITKAEGKCEEILKRVMTDKNAELYKNADLLKEKGTELLKAASEAKTQAEQNVKSALQAVVEMDTSLKIDLKAVKDGIKTGIMEVIRVLKVNELDKEVKSDLGILRERITKLREQVESSNVNGEGLVGGQLKQLKSSRETLDRVTGPQGSIQNATNNLDQKFKEEIQSPLILAIEKVDSAIGALGGKFELNGGKDKLETIFGHIKEEVGEIKGGPGRTVRGTWQNNSGLDGIKERVKGLAHVFVKKGNNSGFKGRVEGWLEGVIGNKKDKPGLQAVNSWLGTNSVDALRGSIKDQIMKQLKHQIDAAQGMITQDKISDGPNTITENLKAIKLACETFVKELDGELTKGRNKQFVDKITPGIGNSPGGATTNDDLKTAIRAALVALCASARQVGNELNFLGISVFGTILDEIKPTVDDLYKKLDDATSTPKPGQPPTPEAGTAQAVDSRLQVVRKIVEQEITNKFNNEVKQPLETAVRGLTGAVNEFDKQAQEQIKAAAKKAITEAGGQISKDNVNITLSDDLMKQFKTVHEKIIDTQTGLQPSLEGLLQGHIGEDDPASGGVNIKDSGQFKDYDKHVKQDSDSLKNKTLTGEQGIANEGLLPEAIGNIKTKGLKVSNKHIYYSA
ncbi:Extracellular matrix-binding ebh, putative [Babesia ovata]|uniref:Extracellular matrix-binding ebh, putative n=1 Tax=Babesia ovata TaxID=189622 RepID=A0A2H6K6U6_9APIC|nr:Extracellular matrix-binding ebh, putative [Babesia ovata]GBE58698.1 Extracellular matrix-binding ebh, putative [Babesia ovata]